MWRDENDNLMTLQETAAAIYRRGLNRLLKAIDAHDEAPSGVAAFDRLEAGQQLVLLDHVSTALLDASIPAPEPTAVKDLAVSAVYGHICREVEAEVRGGALSYWRDWIIEAGHEAGRIMVPTLSAKDPDRWTSEVEAMRDRLIRWFACEAYDELLDNPRRAAKVRQDNDLPADYHTGIPPEPTEADVAAARKRLDQLAVCGALMELRLHFQKSRRSTHELRVSIGDWIEHEADGHRCRGPVLAMTDQLCVFEIRACEDLHEPGSKPQYSVSDHKAVPWQSVRLLPGNEQEARNVIEYVHPRSTLTELHSVRPKKSPTPVAVFWRREDAETWAKQQPSSCTVVSRNFDPLPGAADEL